MVEVNLRELAEKGARIRLQEIALEQAQLIKAFPSLVENGLAPRVRRSRSRRRRMDAAQREAVSQRMTAYWRERRRKG